MIRLLGLIVITLALAHSGCNDAAQTKPYKPLNLPGVHPELKLSDGPTLGDAYEAGQRLQRVADKNAKKVNEAAKRNLREQIRLHNQMNAR